MVDVLKGIENSAYPEQTASEDLGLHCLLFSQAFCVFKQFLWRYERGKEERGKDAKI